MDIIYDQAHMYGISGRYKESAEKYKEAAKLIEGAAQNMKDHFKGSGSIAFEETAEAIIEHLGLLEICSTILARFVDTTYEESYMLDVGMSQGFGYTP